METSRDKILGRLKAAQDKRGETGTTAPDFTSPIYHPLKVSLAADFKTNLELIGGEVILCATKAEVVQSIIKVASERNQNRLFCIDPILQELLNDRIEISSGDREFQEMNIGLTRCEFLVAHLGSVLISSAQISGRRLNVYPETHIVVANESQITDYLDAALEKIQEKYKNKLPSLISNITGPSRTADIEKTLVMGMHGPKSLIVIISEESI